MEECRFQNLRGTKWGQVRYFMFIYRYIIVDTASAVVKDFKWIFISILWWLIQKKVSSKIKYVPWQRIFQFPCLQCVIMKPQKKHLDRPNWTLEDILMMTKIVWRWELCPEHVRIPGVTSCLPFKLKQINISGETHFCSTFQKNHLTRTLI